MGRRTELRELTDQEVAAWMAPRRATWQVAIENNGIDGGVGAIVRAHNAFAGGGIQLLGSGAYNKRVAVGTHQHEPIRLLDAVEGSPVVGVEADPAFPPLPVTLWPEATYVFGHDGLGLSPALAAGCDARLGPPVGWNAATPPAMLAHLAMWRLRSHASAESLLPPAATTVAQGDDHASTSHQGVPGSGRAAEWQDDWPVLSRAQQRARLPFTWWVERFAWTVRRDWWVHLPHGQTPLNAVMTTRNVLAAGGAGVITTDDPGPERAPLGAHCQVRPFTDVVAWARAEGRVLVALEQGGMPLRAATLPDRAVLIAGHEVHGLSRDQRAACEATITLPQWGSVNSYNVANAVGLCLDAAPLAP